MSLRKEVIHQRGEQIMAQGILGFKYEPESRRAGMTALAGLPLYLELASVLKLRNWLDREVGVRAEGQGWTDSQVGMALILLNLAGGSCVEDLRKLEEDEGFCQVLRRVELAGMPRRQRRELERRWRKEKQRGVPSPSAVFRYLAAFHDPDQEQQRVEGKAFIPVANRYLKGLVEVNRKLVESMYGRQGGEVATLDQDATLVETGKEQALFCYQHYRAYQPFNSYWAELGVLLHSEFRDGNVPAGYQQQRVLAEALDLLPAGVKRVRLRSDTAAYQQELLRYCAEGKHPRFGRIEFAIGVDVTAEFRRAVGEVEEAEWQPIYQEVQGEQRQTGREWAEVCFVPSWVGHSKKGPEYRFLATREAIDNCLPGMEEAQPLPFPTLEMHRQRYKLYGMVTNLDWEGGKLIEWQQQRCGKSEEMHSVMKEDLAGGTLPSGDFGENAAWWGFMILALNLNVALKRWVLGGEWANKRMKAIRFGLIHLPGRVLERSRQLVIRLSQRCSAYGLLLRAREKILGWVPCPTG
jgi:hypothetical protein